MRRELSMKHLLDALIIMIRLINIKAHKCLHTKIYKIIISLMIFSLIKFNAKSHHRCSMLCCAVQCYFVLYAYSTQRYIVLCLTMFVCFTAFHLRYAGLPIHFKFKFQIHTTTLTLTSTLKCVYWFFNEYICQNYHINSHLSPLYL